MRNSRHVRGEKKSAKKASAALGSVFNKFLDEKDRKQGKPIDFVYPYGATLNVRKPSFTVMSSGAICYPLNRPIAAAYYHKPSGGKLFVIGSIRFFDDEFFEKENNQKLQEAIFSWLLSNECEIQNTVRDSAELTNKNFVPDVASMADRLRSCLQASE